MSKTLARSTDRERRARQRQIAYTRWLVLIFCAGGGAAIAFGWRGMASEHCADCQLRVDAGSQPAGSGLDL
jgi:hypothetical protein